MIDKLLNILKSKFPDIIGIYFFGSRARGNYNADSDYDILIIFNHNIDYKFESEVRSIVYDYMVENDLLIDSIICTQNEIADPSIPLYLNVKKEGIYYGI